MLQALNLVFGTVDLAGKQEHRRREPRQRGAGHIRVECAGRAVGGHDLHVHPLVPGGLTLQQREDRVALAVLGRQETRGEEADGQHDEHGRNRDGDQAAAGTASKHCARTLVGSRISRSQGSRRGR